MHARGVKTPKLREKYKREHCVWNWSTKNPSRPAHSTSTPAHSTSTPAHNTSTQHQHIAPAPAHSTIAQHKFSLLMSWASGENSPHQLKPTAKAKATWLLKQDQEQQGPSQTPRRCRAGKVGSQAQGGAGQATGRSRASTGASDQTQPKSIINITTVTHQSQHKTNV
jgi:hypothetical protein